VSRSSFVGREQERATLDTCLRAAVAGEGQVVLVAGEPGVGKTRLAEETAHRARAAGLAVATGRATEDEGSPPYWLFRQVFRALGLAPPGQMGPTSVASGESPQQRFQLFEAATDALVAAAEPAGLFIILDDVQWADSASVRLLVHLAQGASRSRLMVLAAYRDTETANQEPLRAAVATLAREPGVTRIRLTGLTEPEVAAHLSGVVGWPVPAPVAAAVCRRTQGNPFFVGELGRVLVSSVDGRLPDGVRDAVRDRLARLSAPCQDIISAAAVLGSDVDASALAVAAGQTLHEVLTALDEAAAAGIVVGRERFTHDLIREAARLDVSTAERLALHRRMADYLSARGDADARVAEVAYHRLEALPTGDPTLAVVWAERAAERAMAQYAWEGAAALYQRALNATVAHDLAGPAEWCRLLLALADAEVRSFALAEARTALVEAVRIARQIGDPESIARAALTMEGVSDHLWDATGRALCAEALAGLPDEDSALRARLLAMRVSMTVWDEQDDRARSAEALAMAERVGDRRAIREALRARQMAMSGPDGAAERIALGDRMVALGADGDDETVLWGRLWRFDGLAQLGDLDAAEAEAEPIAGLAGRLRSPFAAWHAVRCRAAIAGARGRFGEAMTLAAEALRLAERAGTGGPTLPSQGMLVIYRLLIGEPGEFPDNHVPPGANAIAAAFLSNVYGFWLLATGDRDGAARIYRRSPPPSAVPPTVELTALTWMIDFAVEFDDRERAAACYQRLLPHADLLVCGGAGIVCIVGTVRQALGLAAALLGRLDDAVKHLRAGVELANRIGMPPAAASATYHLARVLARRKRPATWTRPRPWPPRPPRWPSGWACGRWPGRPASSPSRWPAADPAR
jgi:tetratricopeptide (TPR) repeat protein